jgi:hypothetical protein
MLPSVPITRELAISVIQQFGVKRPCAETEDDGRNRPTAADTAKYQTLHFDH